jgi:hypothetical protein
MHIPVCETQKMDIISFDEAKRCESEGSFEYDRDKWLYVPNAYTEYRYILGTKGENPLICIGINPSTAKPDDLDNTLKSVERTAKHNGYDSLLCLTFMLKGQLIPRIWIPSLMIIYIEKI